MGPPPTGRKVSDLINLFQSSAPSPPPTTTPRTSPPTARLPRKTATTAVRPDHVPGPEQPRPIAQDEQTSSIPLSLASSPRVRDQMEESSCRGVVQETQARNVVVARLPSHLRQFKPGRTAPAPPSTSAHAPAPLRVPTLPPEVKPPSIPSPTSPPPSPTVDPPSFTALAHQYVASVPPPQSYPPKRTISPPSYPPKRPFPVSTPPPLPSTDGEPVEVHTGDERGRFSDPAREGFLSVMEQETWDDWIGEGRRGSWFRGGKELASKSLRGTTRRKERGKGLWWTRWTRRGIVDEDGMDERLVPLANHLHKQRPPPPPPRSLIFPPFHLVPPDVPMDRLKLNKGKEGWIDWSSWMGSTLDGILGAESSSVGLSMETVERLRDFLQMITMLSLPVSGISSLIGWKRTLLITLPHALSLDLITAFGSALLFLLLLTIITFYIVYELWNFTGRFKGLEHVDRGEGKDFCEGGTKGGRGRCFKVAITFAATSLYLPGSRMAIGALLWTSDFWDPSSLTSIEVPPACYQTNTRFNYAYIMLPIAASTLIWLTVFLPWRIHSIVKRERPRVDRYTEVGEARKDAKEEYKRLLESDRGPFSFLYRGYTRRWASFKSIYMLIKLSNVLIILLVSPANCVFPTHTASNLSILRQSTLVALLSLFLILNIISKPYIDAVSNRSERVSRIGFVLVALIGLLVALEVGGYQTLGGPILIAVQVIVYALNGYYLVWGTEWAQKWWKRSSGVLELGDLRGVNWEERVARRIWIDTWDVLLLTGNEFKMHGAIPVRYLEDECDPPYLLNFKGTVAERHVENLKILRFIGLDSYTCALVSHHSPTSTYLREVIQRDLAGPDVFYYPSFGRLDFSPFPFALTFHPDHSRVPIRLTDLPSMLDLVNQNKSKEIVDAKRVRLALRALEGTVVHAPHELRSIVHLDNGMELVRRSNYTRARLTILANSSVKWRGTRYSSGFNVRLHYIDGRGVDAEGVQREGMELEVGLREVVEIDPSWGMTKGLAKFLRDNRGAIEEERERVEGGMESHRKYFWDEARLKEEVLSYDSLLDFVNRPSSPASLDKSLSKEPNPIVRGISTEYRGAIKSLRERMDVVEVSGRTRAWFVFWDDLYCRNKSLGVLQSDASDPYYRGSIAYNVMTRQQLYKWLDGRGFVGKGRTRRFFDERVLDSLFALMATADEKEREVVRVKI